MVFYKRTIEGEWYVWRERRLLAVISWIVLLAIITLKLDWLSFHVISFLGNNQAKILIFIIFLFVTSLVFDIGRLEHIYIMWKHDAYNRPESDYDQSGKQAIFASSSRWFKIKRLNN